MTTAPARFQCDNCGELWTEDDLLPARDLDQRLDPGGVVPDGECPDPACGALCYRIIPEPRPRWGRR